MQNKRKISFRFLTATLRIQIDTWLVFFLCIVWPAYRDFPWIYINLKNLLSKIYHTKALMYIRVIISLTSCSKLDSKHQRYWYILELIFSQRYCLVTEVLLYTVANDTIMVFRIPLALYWGKLHWSLAEGNLAIGFIEVLLFSRAKHLTEVLLYNRSEDLLLYTRANCIEALLLTRAKSWWKLALP